MKYSAPAIEMGEVHSNQKGGFHMFDGEIKEFKRDTEFLEGVSLWGVFKAVLTVALIYGLVYTIWQYNSANQEAQRIQEVGMAITALAAEGYSIYIDGEREVFVPDIKNYDIEFDRESKAIFLTRHIVSEKAMWQGFFGLGEGNGLFSSFGR